MKTPNTFSSIELNDDFINEWFDTFNASVKTFVIDYVINKLKKYNFDIEMIQDEKEKGFARTLAIHFTKFLELKMIDKKLGK